MSIPEVESLTDAQRFSDMLMAQALDDANEVRAQMAVNDVCQAIRRLQVMDCKQVQTILHVLSNKMVQMGYPPSDVDPVADVADLIGG